MGSGPRFPRRAAVIGLPHQRRHIGWRRSRHRPQRSGRGGGKGTGLVLYAAKKVDLDAALATARTEASLILDQVNHVQTELARTTFVGEQAEMLAEEMNAKMRVFVQATYENVDGLLLAIVNSMNVVVTKLGGRQWEHLPVERGQVGMAGAMRSSGNTDYEIDTDEMAAFAVQVDGWFENIATSYNKIRSAIVDGTPGWQGPEKIQAVGQVNDVIDQILGSAGGDTGVRGVGASLSRRLRDQVTVMNSGT